MDTSILFEQLEWAFDQDILEGGNSDKIHAILKEALENEYDNGHGDGYEEGRCDFQTG